MAPFVTSIDNNAADSNKYELYAVLISAGGALGGHYFAFLKDFSDGQWYNFNDSRYKALLTVLCSFVDSFD